MANNSTVYLSLQQLQDQDLVEVNNKQNLKPLISSLMIPSLT